LGAAFFPQFAPALGLTQASGDLGHLGILLTALGSVAAGNVANAIDALTLGQEPDWTSLGNKDLTRAVGKAIASVLMLVAQKNTQSRNVKANLQQVARSATDNWLNYYDRTIREENIKDIITPVLRGESSEVFLSQEDWKDIFIWLNMKSKEGGGFFFPEELYNEVAADLKEFFPKALLEVLKEDFARDGRAYAALSLQLLTGLRQELQQGNDEILSRVTQVENALREGEQDFFPEVSSQIESGFTQICERLGVVTEGINDLLQGQEAIEEQLRELTGEIRNNRAPSQTNVNINWIEICNNMLEPQRRLSSNLLLHTNEDSKFKREQIYVPLALIERRKSDKREGGIEPQVGTSLYEPHYEEKQRFEHEAFLEQILLKREGKTKGKQIAIIGEPGAGKTTLLQTIAAWVLEQKLGLPIWISLADLGKQSTWNIWKYLQSTWLSVATSPTQKTVAEIELAQKIEEGNVWLLLDGVDEAATSGLKVIQELANQLKGWLAQSQVILTCRLNVWEGDKNALADFETYRLLDFDYPQQVHQFIDNWFSSSNFTEKKERLKTELEKPEKTRLRDLIQNPLRLTLLCASWQNNEGELPKTKAGLYAQFVEQVYKWKSDIFPITFQEKRLLNKALGQLALQDIDTGNTRFRLRESFVREAIGDDSLFEKALQLGWLNNVGIAAESPTKERVYAFFHASFEEYFAAMEIDSAEFFLNHNNENPNPLSSNVSVTVQGVS
jgi:DNA replication protein DnaC